MNTLALKVALAYTNIVLVLLVPMTESSSALKALPSAMVTGALAVIGAVEEKIAAALKVGAALTVRLCVLSVPRTVLLLAMKSPATLMVLVAETAA